MLIMSNVVRGMYSLEDELLFQKEYEILFENSKVMRNIISCEVKNVADRSFYNSRRINIDFTFDIVIIYEYEDSETTKRSYDIIIEKVRKTFQLDMNVYGISMPDMPDIKLINKLKKVKCNIDTFSNQDKFSVHITGLIDSYLVQEDIVPINNSSAKNENNLNVNNKVSSTDRPPIKEQKQRNLESEVTESLVEAEMNLCDAMNKVTNLYNTNSDLKNKLKIKEKQIEYFGGTINTLKKSNQELQVSFNELSMELNELKQKINSQHEVIKKLKEDLSSKEKYLKEVLDENLKLKEDIQSMQDKKKNSIIEKVRLGMQNII